jgi:hypothetical protein
MAPALFVTADHGSSLNTPFVLSKPLPRQGTSSGLLFNYDVSCRSPAVVMLHLLQRAHYAACAAHPAPAPSTTALIQGPRLKNNLGLVGVWFRVWGWQGTVVARRREGQAASVCISVHYEQTVRACSSGSSSRKLHLTLRSRSCCSRSPSGKGVRTTTQTMSDVPARFKFKVNAH